MTKQTFYRKLRKYASQFQWKFFHNSQCIRASREDVNGDFCPITAVYFAEHGIRLSSSDYHKAADKMNMDYLEAAHIAFGADNDNGNNSAFKTSMSARKAILRSVGLG